MAWSTRRSGSRRNCTWPRGSASTRWSRRSSRASASAARAGASPSTPCSRPCGRPRARWRSPNSRSGTGTGAEAGWPPSRHLDAFQYVARENFHITIHAGEGFGLPSIWEALQWCGAERLGHGVRIMDDIQITPEGTATLGRLASYVRARRIPLEMCPTSNVQTGAAPSIETHPIRLLRQLSFRVTVNTDNRLMSGVTLSSEFHRLAEAFGYGWRDIEWLTINAMKSAFAHFDERLRIIDTVIKPGYATARAASDAVVRLSAPGS